MALPKIEAPIYSFESKATGNRIKHIATLMKHEKIFAVAMENLGEESVEVTTRIVNEVIEQILSDCLIDVELKDLSSTEMEELWLNIRAVSASPELNLTFDAAKSCIDSGHFKENTAKVNVLDYNIESVSGKTIAEIAEEHNMIVKEDGWLFQITEQVGVKLELPKGFKTQEFAGITSVVTSIYDNESVYDNFTEEELNDFLGQVPMNLVKTINEFIDAIPTVVMPVNLKCEQCGKERDTKLKGIYDFFV